MVEWNDARKTLPEFSEENNAVICVDEYGFATIQRGRLADKTRWWCWLKGILPAPTFQMGGMTMNKQKPNEYKDAEEASVEYRKFRKECGILDPVMLDEIEEAYYLGITSRHKHSEVWSEEDDAMLNQAIEEVEYALNDKSLLYTGNENVLVWLKSLKQRLGASGNDNSIFKTTNVGNSSITVEGKYNPTKDASV